MQLGNVDALPDFFDMALVGDQYSSSLCGLRHAVVIMAVVWA